MNKYSLEHPIDPNPGRVRQGWCIPKTIRRFGSELMQQQLWCWGRDIERCEGNLLIKYGFERHRDDEFAPESTCYRLDLNDLHICLWGFGMFFGKREFGGIYLNRFDFRPTWAPIESLADGIHWPDELPSFDRPKGELNWYRARNLWKNQLGWISEYEAWIREVTEPSYRSQTVASWLRPYVTPKEMAAAWRFLSDQAWGQATQPLNILLKPFKLTKGKQ
ncbi:MAG: hypothetical protein CMJ82_13195 [Planctomycetaceae bacterium]|nr:hypothetical protein [Planctomycetaceae bacterium]|tara:strand:- start:308 stop:967 length:660 start_codon:yes stop_codon:yes gene_type:complete